MAKLRAIANLLDVRVDPARLGATTPEQHLRLSALVLAAVEHHQFLCDLHAQHAGLAAAVQEGAKAILPLCQDTEALLGYGSWRCQRDAVVLTSIHIHHPEQHPDLLAAAVHATQAAAHLITMLHGLLLDQASADHSNPDLAAAGSLTAAGAALRRANEHLARGQAASTCPAPAGGDYRQAAPPATS